MRLPLRALLDPANESRSFDVGERQMRIRSGHHHLGVGAEDAPDQFAAVRIAGDDGPSTRRQLAKGDLGHVQAQGGLARAVVGTVTLEAAI
jgi:hypothetical protein